MKEIRKLEMKKNIGARTGRDCSGSLLKQVTLTAGRRERPKEATWRTLPEKEAAKQLQAKSPAACQQKNNRTLMQHFFASGSQML